LKTNLLKRKIIDKLETYQDGIMKFYLTTFALIITFLLKFQFQANASTKFSSENCSLPKGEQIVVGCTVDCGRFNKWALRRYARKNGYKVKIIDLYSENQTPDISAVDAILIPGGADINPKFYTQNIDEELRLHIESLDYLVNYTEEGKRRDQFEYDLLKNYFSSQSESELYTPVLGICRGMQMLTVSQGIPLIVDIKKELGIKNRRYTLDKIKITNPESLISEIQGRTTFRGVELHHQGLRLDYFKANREKWPHLDVTALSNGDRIAEVLEFYNRPALGVQFHTEYTFGKTRRRIFSWLLKRACIKKNILNSKTKVQ